MCIYLSAWQQKEERVPNDQNQVQQQAETILEASLFLAAEYVHEDIYKSCYINTKREAFPSWESANN